MKTYTTPAVTMAALAVAATLITGCASTDFYPNNTQTYPAASSYPAASPQYGSMYGVVDSIEVRRGSSGGVGAGAVVGGVVGGLLGNQVGSGNGRTAATVVGAVGGAVVGNQVEQRNRVAQDSYAIRVRLDNGSYQLFTQDSVNDLRVGSRVRVENGRVNRY